MSRQRTTVGPTKILSVRTHLRAICCLLRSLRLARRVTNVHSEGEMPGKTEIREHQWASMRERGCCWREVKERNIYVTSEEAKPCCNLIVSAEVGVKVSYWKSALPTEVPENTFILEGTFKEMARFLDILKKLQIYTFLTMVFQMNRFEIYSRSSKWEIFRKLFERDKVLWTSDNNVANVVLSVKEFYR